MEKYINTKQMRNRVSKLPTWQVLIVALVLVMLSYFIKSNEALALDEAFLISCVDGDTANLKVDGVKESVRFIAVDTPELSSQDFFAQEAADFTCNALKQANQIQLEFDPESDPRDKHGRMIAWVHVDDVLLQRDLVKGGYAKVKYIYGDYRYVDELNRLQTSAKKSGLGIWKK